MVILMHTNIIYHDNFLAQYLFNLWKDHAASGRNSPRKQPVRNRDCRHRQGVRAQLNVIVLSATELSLLGLSACKTDLFQTVLSGRIHPLVIGQTVKKWYKAESTGSSRITFFLFNFRTKCAHRHCKA